MNGPADRRAGRQTPTHIAAMILAGGKSERMGSPKALLRYRGSTFLEHILSTIDACPAITDRILVVGKHAREIRDSVPEIRLVLNSDYALGMTTSFQAGIRALRREADHVVVFLVDHPLVVARTVRLLAENAGRAEVVVPVFAGRRGHPVVFSRRFMEEILELPVDRGVDSLVKSDPDWVWELQVDDAGVLRDIDTPEQFESLLRDRNA